MKVPVKENLPSATLVSEMLCLQCVFVRCIKWTLYFMTSPTCNMLSCYNETGKPQQQWRSTRGPKGHISCTWVQCDTFLKKWPGPPSCFSNPPEKYKLCRGHWDLASCHVMLNSVQRFQRRSRKCLSQSEAMAAILFFWLAKKTQTW